MYHWVEGSSHIAAGSALTAADMRSVPRLAIAKRFDIFLQMGHPVAVEDARASLNRRPDANRSY